VFMGFSGKCWSGTQLLRERIEFKVGTVPTVPEHGSRALNFFNPSVNKIESEHTDLDENQRNIYERFIILLDQAEGLHNSYCEHKIQLRTEGDWRLHFAVTPLTQNEDNVRIGARVQSLHSEQSQDVGLLPGMLLISIDEEIVKNSTFDVILALLDEPHVYLVFEETWEEIKENIKLYNGIRERAEGISRSGWTDIACASSGIVDLKTAEILEKNLESTESTLTAELDKADTATSSSASSSASGKSMSDNNYCNLEFSRFVNADQITRCPIHPVVDLWPRLLQSDEYMIIFQSRPLGIRVRQDREGKNAVVWKITGHHAKAAGIEWGSMVYSVNEESVYGWQHLDIVDKIRNATLPLKIIFWRQEVLLEINSEEHMKH